MKKLIFVAVLMSNSASANELGDIEQQFYCSLFSYTLLKTDIAGGKLTLSDEIQQLDRVGGHLGKARELVLSKHGSGMSHYANYRNKVLKIFNKDIKNLQNISPVDQNKWGYETGLKCGELFAQIFYTDKDIKTSKEGLKKMNEILKKSKK